ncbi:MAG: right-handed parallel beta-helix repeat-containing protein [Candidatus Bathyarchaeia archaeon]
MGKSKRLSLGSISIAVLSFTLFVLAGPIARFLCLSIALDFTLSAGSLNFLLAVEYPLRIVMYFVFGGLLVYTLVSHRRFDGGSLKRSMLLVFSVVIVGLMLSAMLYAPIVKAETTAVTGYYLARPIPGADWYLGKLSDGTYYAINGSNWNDLTAVEPWQASPPWASYASNSTAITQQALASLTYGEVYMKEVPFNLNLMGSIPPNVQVVDNVNGVTYTYVNPLSSLGSPYTVSVGTGNNAGDYVAADSGGRIMYAMNNASRVIQDTIMNNSVTEIAPSASPYWLSNTIYIAVQNYTLEGTWQSHLEMMPYVNTTMIRFSSTDYNGNAISLIKNVQIEGLQLDGNGYNEKSLANSIYGDGRNYWQGAITCDDGNVGVSQCFIDNCYIHDSSTGIYFDTPGIVSNFTIQNCYIENTTWDGILPIYVVDGLIANNYLISDGFGCALQGATGCLITGNHFENIGATFCSGTADYIQGGDFNDTVSNNIYTEPYSNPNYLTFGIQLESFPIPPNNDVSNIRIIGNTFTGRWAYAINIGDASNNFIYGNDIEATQTYWGEINFYAITPASYGYDSNNVIENNRIVSPVPCIRFDSAESPAVGNIIADNTLVDTSGYITIAYDGVSVQTTNNYLNGVFTPVGLTLPTTNIVNSPVSGSSLVNSANKAAPTIFSSNFNSGSYSGEGWTGIATNEAGNTISIVQGASTAGYYSSKSVIANTTGASYQNYAYSYLSGLNQAAIYVGGSFMVNNLPASDGQYVELMAGIGSDKEFGVYLEEHWGTNLLVQAVVSQSGTNEQYQSSNEVSVLQSGVPFFLSAYFVVSSTVGQIQVWLNGVNVISETGLNTAARGNIASVDFGCCPYEGTNYATTVYVNGASISASYIYPIQPIWENTVYTFCGNGIPTATLTLYLNGGTGVNVFVNSQQTYWNASGDETITLQVGDTFEVTWTTPPAPIVVTAPYVS